MKNNTDRGEKPQLSYRELAALMRVAASPCEIVPRELQEAGVEEVREFYGRNTERAMRERNEEIRGHTP